MRAVSVCAQQGEERGSHVPLAAVHAQDLDRHERVAAAALAVRERAEHLPVHLPDAQQRLCVRGGRHAQLPQACDVLAARDAVARVVVGRRARLHRQRLAREQHGLRVGVARGDAEEA